MEKNFIVRQTFVNGNIHLKETLTVEDLLRVSDPVVEKAVAQIDDALKMANLDASDIQLVILAGGSSQLPGVREKIRKKLNIEPCEIPRNLMLAVSYGAALYHREIIMLPKSKQDKRILGHNISIFVDDGGAKKEKVLLWHNQELPAKAQHKFFVDEGMSVATINLMMSNNRERKFLQKRNLELSGNAKEIIVDIFVDENRIISLAAYDPEHPETKAAIRCAVSTMDANSIKQAQEKLGITATAKRGNGGKQDCIGIDLGTTTSELSYCNRTGVVELEALDNPEPVAEKELGYAKYCFPSVVYYKDGFKNIQVANQAAVDAMGGTDTADRCFDTFKIKPRTRPLAEIDGEPVMVRDLSAKLLNKIWETAQNEFANPPSAAVITVPAAFSPDECQDTYNAAEIAGIETITLIDEPTAAFYYYKHVQELDLEEVQNVLVFDFGGGTCDVAILDVKENGDEAISPYKDCIYKVLSTCGDKNCGGRDVDNALLDEICARFEEKNGCKVSPSALRRIRDKVEAAKIELSEIYRETMI